MKKIITIQSAPKVHWDGDGFPVRSLFSYDSGQVARMSSFLLLVYGGPAHTESADKSHGVGAPPSVTIVYQGEVEHRDSTGQGGVIGPVMSSGWPQGTVLCMRSFTTKALPGRVAC